MFEYPLSSKRFERIGLVITRNSDTEFDKQEIMLKHRREQEKQIFPTVFLLPLYSR